MKTLRITSLILIGILFILNSCTVEDIILPQAELTVYNLSEQTVEINYRNVDTGVEVSSATTLEPGLAGTLPLDIGYEFEIIAVAIHENTQYKKNFEIKPHKEYEWQIIGK
jgi:hypothetical protein